LPRGATVFGPTVCTLNRPPRRFAGHTSSGLSLSAAIGVRCVGGPPCPRRRSLAQTDNLLRLLRRDNHSRQVSRRLGPRLYAGRRGTRAVGGRLTGSIALRTAKRSQWVDPAQSGQSRISTAPFDRRGQPVAGQASGLVTIESRGNLDRLSRAQGGSINQLRAERDD
jgi:hypothetical protein